MMSTPLALAFTGKRIALTSANSWGGCCAAVQLSRGLEKNFKGAQLVCLVRDDENLALLKNLKNVKVEKVDYEDETTLERALQGVTCTVMFLEWHERRVPFGKKLVAAMKKAHVNSCLMVSILGAGQSQLRGHRAYHEVEQEVRGNIPNYVILRKAILSQVFLLWSSSVKERGQFPMATDKNTLATHVDLIDVVGVIETVVNEHCQVDSQRPDSIVNSFGKHTHKIYTLAGPEQTHPGGIVQILNESSDNNVEFKKVSREELREYFMSLIKNEGWEVPDVDQCNSIMNSEGDNRRQIALTLPMIDMLLDEYEWCSIDNALVPDMREVLGYEGRTLRDFFLKEKEAFKPYCAQNHTEKSH
ncbi:hypothetical protein BG005_010554 [Podila minutissima]|nr:hypothetical protein BG005_010554 [Podila minutissima]